MKDWVYIDGDVLLYEAVFGTIHTMDCGDAWWQFSGNHEEAVERIRSRVIEIRKASKCKRAMLILSDDSSRIFRLGFFPEYKANRRKKNSSKPPHFIPTKRDLLGLEHTTPVSSPEIMESVTIDHGWCVVRAEPTLEADDLISIEMDRNPGVVSSIDKDLYQIPGVHVHLETLAERTIHPEQGDILLYKQAISGDSTDNIPGCPTLGAVRAGRIIDSAVAAGKNLWDTVVEAYESKGQTVDDAITNMRLVRMLRDGEYKNGVAELWTP